MMQVFRNAAKPVLYVLTISFFVWLVWDLSGLGTGTGNIFSRSSVGKVNGESIDIRLFDQRVQAISAEQQQRGGALGLDEVQAIRDQVWDETVRAILLRDEYLKRGLAVSSAEVAEAIRNVPPPEIQQAANFQTNGQFDIEKYQRWLASSEGQQYIPALEAQYRDQLLQAKLFRSVVSDVFVSDATLWERFRDEREQVKVAMVRIDPATNVNDQAVPTTTAELETYYNAHKEEFRRPRGAHLSYLYVPRATNAADSAAALARAQSVRNEIVAGAPFEEVARRESADSVSGPQGGDLGEITKAGVIAEFWDAAAKLPLNTLSEPILTPFGYHLVRVESRTADRAKARHILIPIEIVGTHRDQIDAIADSLENLAAEKFDRAALDTAASALKLTVRAVGPVGEGTRIYLPEGGQVPDAGVWAFQAEPNEHSPVIESTTGIYVFRLDSLIKEGVPPFPAARPAVEAKVRMVKKQQEARKLAETIVQQVGAGTSLADAAKAVGATHQDLGPFARLTSPLGSPTLTGVAFALRPGQLSRVLTTDTEADLGVYLLQGLERTPADSAEFAKGLAQIRQQALQAAKRSRVQAYLTALRESAKIVDRRNEIYRTSAQATAAATPPTGY